MAVKGIIFDLNGVLWWDGDLQEHAWRQFSGELRGWPLSPDELAVHVHGRNNRHTLEVLTGRRIDGDELVWLTQRKEAIYRQLCLEQGSAFRLSPGAPELLDFLAAHGIPRTIATASEKTNLEFFARHLSLAKWFDLDKIVYDDGTRPGKPAPDIYLQAASNLGLPPAQCMVVEDSRSGIAAAYAAGIGHIVALGPADRHGELARLAGVDRVVDSLWELPRELFLSRR
jgi:beta-phosphoglucomutase-like phosphatase (HAD superfamily)